MSRRDLRLNPALLLAIAVLVILVWWPGLNAPFYLDSAEAVAHNPALRITALTPEQLGAAAVSLPHGRSLNKRWLVALSFALDYRMYGLNPAGFRATNLALHLLNGLLVLLVMLRLQTIPRLTSEPGRAAFVATAVAALWLLNPLQTSAVTYVWGRTSLMAALFYLLALWAYLEARLSTRPAARIGFAAAVPVLWVAAMSCKEIAAVLPATLVVIEAVGFGLTPGRRRWLLPLMAAATLVFGLGLLYLFLGPAPFAGLHAGAARRGYTVAERVMTEWRVIVDYLGLLAWPLPTRLSLEHDVVLSRALLAPPTTLLALSFILATLGLALWFWWRGQRLAALAIVWFYLHLALESSVIPLELMFEHRLYLPAIGPMLLLALGLARLPSRRVAVGAAAALVLLWAGWSWQRNAVWAEPERFWQQAVALAPNKPRPWLQLGLTQERMGQMSAALRSYDRAVELYAAPSDERETRRTNVAAAYGARGLLLKRMGRLQEARADFERGYAIDPRSITLRGEIAVVTLALGDASAALADLDAFIAEHPRIPMAYGTRGAAKLALGRPAAAIEDLDEALRARPEQVEWLNLRGTAYAQQGRWALARADFERVLVLAPDNADARAKLALLRRQSEGSLERP